MKFATASEHRSFFRKNGFIEFEGLIDPLQISLLQHAVKEVICSRLSIPIEQYEKLSPDQLFSQGHDLWRDNILLKKTILSVNLAQILSELMDEQKLRLGFDQLVPLSKVPVMDALGTKSSIRDLIAALLISLSAPTPNLFFFKTGQEISSHEIFKKNQGPFILITYVTPNAMFQKNLEDPFDANWKKIGYTYGDKLQDKWNPLVTT